MIDREVLIRYLKSEGTVSDKKAILDSFDNEKDEAAILSESQKFWDECKDVDVPDYNETSMLIKIYRLIKIDERTFISRRKPKINFINPLIRIAAVFTIPLLLTSLLFLTQNISMRKSVSWAEIHAPIGTRTDFKLPDGSSGKLNGGSILRFPAIFTEKTRSVELTGEAFFDVSSNPKRPFVVSTRDIEIRVKGTSFNIMAYPDEFITEVTLKEGEVTIFRKEDSLTSLIGNLKPDEQFVYNSLNRESKIEPEDVTNILSWMDNKLTFRYEPFPRVIQKLNRWYNVDIRIMDNMLESYVYYGTFQSESLDEVLKLLQLTAPITYKNLPRIQRKDGEFEKRIVELYLK